MVLTTNRPLSSYSSHFSQIGIVISDELKVNAACFSIDHRNKVSSIIAAKQ